jgi:hypothetical protein
MVVLVPARQDLTQPPPVQDTPLADATRQDYIAAQPSPAPEGSMVVLVPV